MKTLLQLMAVLLLAAATTANAQSWNLTGNSGINQNNNFLGTTDGKALVLRTNNVERMRILKTGRIGVGTANPDARFNVLVSNNVTLTTTDSFLLGTLSGSNLAFDYNEIQARYNGAANTLYLNYWGGATWLGNHNGTAVPALYTATDGRVGVGSSSIQTGYALTVTASSSLGGVYVTDPVDNNVLRSIKSGNNAGIYVEKTNNASYIAAIYGNTSAGFGAGVEGASSNGDGVYGYSASSFGVEAYANNNDGVYSTTNNNASYYAGFFVGDVYTSGTYFSSDERLKQNIQDFSSAMSIINQLHPKQYQFRHDAIYKSMNLPQGQHYGLIAQDVEKVLPGLVKDSKFETARKAGISETDIQKTESVDFKALNYTELIPVLIKAIQEQQQQIDELNQKIEALTSAQNSSLKSSNSNVSGAYLQQNSPNPFSQNTVVRCNLPSSVKQAQLIIYSNDGKALKSYSLNNSGVNEITINGGALSSGQYKYALIIDGKQVDSKSMILTK